MSIRSLLLLVMVGCSVRANPTIRDVPEDAPPDACRFASDGNTGCCQYLGDQAEIEACLVAITPPGECVTLACEQPDCSFRPVDHCSAPVDAGVPRD